MTKVYIKLKGPIWSAVQDDNMDICLKKGCTIYMITTLIYTSIRNAISVADGCAK